MHIFPSRCPSCGAAIVNERQELLRAGGVVLISQGVAAYRWDPDRSGVRHAGAPCAWFLAELAKP